MVPAMPPISAVDALKSGTSLDTWESWLWKDCPSFALPAALDATYERMLIAIEQIYRPDALTLLRWLAFEQRPLNLLELVEASTVSPVGQGSVDVENRGALEDILEILASLVTVEVSASTTSSAQGVSRACIS